MEHRPSARTARLCLAFAVSAVLSAHAATAASLTWDSNADTAPAGLDGSGSWTTTGLNWYNPATTSNVAWNNANNDIAVFGNGGTAGTVTLGATITAGGLLFNSGTTGNYTLAGTTLILTNTPSITTNAAGTTNITIATIQNSTNGNPNGPLTIDGAGDLNFTSALRFLNIVYNGTGTMTLGGTTDNANSGLTINSGTVILAKVNSVTYHATGGAGMTVNAGGTVKLGGGGGDQIYDGGSITISGTMDMAGLSEGIFRLVGDTTGLITNSSATAATLSIGNSNGTGAIYAGAIQNGAGGLAVNKIGTGTQTLTGRNTYTGTTTVSGGTLILDYSAQAAGTQIISNTSALTVGGGTGSLAGNGTLSLVAKAGSANAQTFNGLTVASGANAVTVTPGTATSMAINFGSSLSRAVGGTLNLAAPTSVISYASGAGTGGQILTIGGVAFMTVGGTDWAAKSVDNSSIVGLSTLGGYTASTATTLSGNADVAAGINTTLSSDTSLTSLRVNVNESRTITLNGATRLTTGGLLVTSTVNSGAGTTISGGSLQGVAGADLVVIQDSAKPLTITSAIVNNITATGLTKSGSGTLILSGNNTYTGVTTVNSGTLQFGNGGTTGQLGSGGLTVNGTLIINHSDAVTISTAVTGIGTFTQLGSGATTFSGANIFTGATTVSAGTLVLEYGTQNNTKLADGSALNLSGGTVRLNGGNHTETVSSTAITAGASAVTRGTGSSKLRLNGIARSVAGGTVDFGAAGLADADTATVNGILGGYATVGGADWAITAATAADTNITALAAGSYTALAASGSDVNNSLLAAGATLTGDLSTNSLKITANTAGQTLNLGAGTLTLVSGGLLVTGSADYAISNGTLKGLATGGKDLIIHQYSAGNLTIGAVIADNAAGTSLTKSGTGTLTLTAANTYTGQTFLNAGVLSISANNQLGAVATGAQLNLSGGTLQATGTFTLDNAGNNKRAVVLNAAGGTFAVTGSNKLTISGVVSGVGGLTKADTGILTLSGANTYTGLTKVTGGILEVSGSISGSISTVSNTGTLAGTGTTGEVNVADGGGIAPGAASGGAGTLNTGSLSLTAGGTVKLELGSTASYDRLNVTGTVDLGGSTLSLSLLGGSSIAEGNLFFVIVNDGSDAVLNPFTGLAEGSVISAGASAFRITYAADSTTSSFTGGNDVALLAVPVPEPGSLSGLLLGGLLLGVRRFRHGRAPARYGHS